MDDEFDSTMPGLSGNLLQKCRLGLLDLPAKLCQLPLIQIVVT